MSSSQIMSGVVTNILSTLSGGIVADIITAMSAMVVIMVVIVGFKLLIDVLRDNLRQREDNDFMNSLKPSVYSKFESRYQKRRENLNYKRFVKIRNEDGELE